MNLQDLKENIFNLIWLIMQIILVIAFILAMNLLFAWLLYGIPIK